MSMSEDASELGSPRYKQIAKAVRNEISSSGFAPGHKLPKDQDLAKRYNTSRLTVIRALRVLELEGLLERRAGSGTFVGSSSAVGAKTFGLLIPDLGKGEIFEPICQGMAQAGSLSEQALLWGHSANDGSDREDQAMELCRLYIARKVSGVFFAPLELSSHQDQINMQILALLEEAKIPIVLLDRTVGHYWDPIRHDLVGIDNWRGGFMMAKHLLDQGCTRLGFVLRPASAPTVEARIAGLFEVARQRRLNLREENILIADPTDKAKVSEWMRTVRPNGILCANDYTAGQLMHTLLNLGFAIPKDVCLVGFDDVRYATLFPVPLTTLRQPCLQIGAAAMRAMVERLENPSMAPRVISLDSELIMRESSRSSERSA